MEKFVATDTGEYRLLDFGDGRRAESWNGYRTLRPDALSKGKMDGKPQVDAEFSGKNWKFFKGKNPPTEITVGEVRFALQAGNSKHLGVFPEQSENWKYLRKHLQEGQNVLNLFAYTGGASVVSALCGATVTHVDSSKSILNHARRTAELNQVQTIRWIQEGAQKFMEKEVRRGNHYDVIIMDPPKKGVDEKGRIMDLSKSLDDLIRLAGELLAPDGRLILNTYSPVAGYKEVFGMLKKHLPEMDWESGVLHLKSEKGELLPTGLLFRTR